MGVPWLGSLRQVGLPQNRRLDPPVHALPCSALLHSALLRSALPCSALLYPALPCPVLPCSGLPFPSLPFTALHCPSLPCSALLFSVFFCSALSSPAFFCYALLCSVQPCPALLWSTLPCPVLSCPALPCPSLPCSALLCSAPFCSAPLCLAMLCSALPCPVLLYPALSCPALPCPALPFPSLSCRSLPFPAMLCPAPLCRILLYFPQRLSGSLPGLQGSLLSYPLLCPVYTKEERCQLDQCVAPPAIFSDKRRQIRPIAPRHEGGGIQLERILLVWLFISVTVLGVVVVGCLPISAKFQPFLLYFLAILFFCIPVVKRVRSITGIPFMTFNLHCE